MAREISFTQTGAIPISTVLVDTVDVDGMQGVSMHVISVGTSGSVQLQQSNDGVAWVSTIMQLTNGGAQGAPVGAGMFWTNLVGRYIRVVMATGASAGTTSFVLRVQATQMSNLHTSNVNVSVSALPATPAGTNLIGKSICDISATQANGPTFLYHRLLASAASTNGTLVKSSAGRLAKVRGYNNSTSVRYLKLYNKSSAPTVGTDTPLITLALKPSDVFILDVEDFGMQFSAGIGYAITGSVVDSDTTAVATNDILGLLLVYI